MLRTVQLINTSSRPINHPSIHCLPLLLLPAHSAPRSLELIAAVWWGRGYSLDESYKSFFIINHILSCKNSCLSSDSLCSASCCQNSFVNIQYMICVYIITEIVLQFLLRSAAGLEILTIEKLPSEDSQLVFVSRPSSEKQFFFCERNKR